MDRGRLRFPSRALPLVFVACLILSLPPVAGAALGAPLFPSPVRWAGGTTDSLAVGDQNGDGYPDLVVGLTASLYYSVLLGNGDGTLRSPIRSNLASTALLMEDFDGDGRGDLLAVQNGALLFAPSLGDGTFGPAIGTAPLGVLEGIAAADFDGDGRLDIAAANRGGLVCPGGCPPFDQGDVVVVRGNGDGTFGEVLRLAAGAAPAVILAADLNGDGRPDLAAGDRAGGLVSVFIGRGDGRFDAAAAVTVSQGLMSLAAGDFNQDGHADLATAFFPQNSALPGGVAVLAGDGAGGFVLGPTLHFDHGPTQVGAGDVDSDGRTDLVVAFSESGTPAIPVVGAFRLRADGVFEPGPRSLALGRLIGFAVADFNVDDLPDVVMASQPFGTPPDVGILLTRPGGGWGPQTQFRTGSARSLTTGDFDGDGAVDLAIALTPQTYCSGSPPYGCWTTTEGVEVFQGDGRGGVGPGVLYAAGARPAAIAAADLNADGLPDLAVVNEGSDDLSVLLAAESGGFGPQTRYPVGESPAGLAVADLNGDPFLDLAVVKPGDAGTPGGLTLLFGQAGGAFGAGMTIETGSAPRSIVAADFDGDGTLDLIGGGELFLGHGDGTFAAPLPTIGAHYMVAGRFDGDRHLDLAAAAATQSGDISVRYGGGDGTFSDAPHPGLPPGSGGSPTIPRIGVGGGGVLATADLNADGRADFVAANFQGSSVSVHLARDDGTLLRPTAFLSGSGTAAVAIADFDGDGAPDVAAATESGAGVILLNSGSNDTDEDGVPDPVDDCPGQANADQADRDHDDVGDACDNCVEADNGDQLDCDLDGRGDVCDANPCGLLQEVVDMTIRFISSLGRQRGVVSWRTTMEIDLRGFNVVSLDPEGRRIQLNPVVIPCEECTTRRGASYSSLVPRHRSNRSIFIELVHADGRVDTFGPAERVVEPGG